MWSPTWTPLLSDTSHYENTVKNTTYISKIILSRGGERDEHKKCWKIIRKKQKLWSTNPEWQWTCSVCCFCRLTYSGWTTAELWENLYGSCTVLFNNVADMRHKSIITFALLEDGCKSIVLMTENVTMLLKWILRNFIAQTKERIEIALLTYTVQRTILIGLSCQ